MPLQLKINPNLKDLPVIDYRKLHEMQGDLKDLTKDKYDKFLGNLVDRGMLAPFMIWVAPTGDMFIVDGHQRKRIFTLEHAQPYEVPFLIIPGETYEEAKKNLLSISSQFGTITEQGFNEFVIDLPADWIQASIHFDALSKQFEESLKPAISALPRDIELKGFARTHILLSFPPEKMIEIQDLLKPILEKSFVEFEQGHN